MKPCRESSGAVASRTSIHAFTLVELLVVIGIIALLIALILPALSGARQVALRTVCAAKLHEQLLAAQVHSLDHHGYYPLVGVLPSNQPPGITPGIQPPDFDDTYSVKYDYFSYEFAAEGRLIAPITASLAYSMSYKNALRFKTNDLEEANLNDDDNFLKHFMCPSQATRISEIVQQPMLYYCFDPLEGWIWEVEPISYIYNEAILGWGEKDPTHGYTDMYNRKHGNSTQIRQPAKTMFVADGFGGLIANTKRYSYITGSPMATIYNIATQPPITLADAFTNDGLAGDPENFDKYRHRGKMNIGFCDGHVETRSINQSDLSTAYILAP